MTHASSSLSQSLWVSAGNKKDLRDRILFFTLPTYFFALAFLRYLPPPSFRADNSALTSVEALGRTSGRDQLISRRRGCFRRWGQPVEQPVVIGHRLLLVASERVNVVTVGPFWRGELEVGRHLRREQHHSVKGLVLGRGHRQIVRLVDVAADPQGVRYVHHHWRRGGCDCRVRAAQVAGPRQPWRQSGLAVVVGSGDIWNSWVHKAVNSLVQERMACNVVLFESRFICLTDARRNPRNDYSFNVSPMRSTERCDPRHQIESHHNERFTVARGETRRRVVRQTLSAIESSDAGQSARRDTQHRLGRGPDIAVKRAVRSLLTDQPSQRRGSVPVVGRLVLHLFQHLHHQRGGVQVAEAAVQSLLLRQTHRRLAHEVMEIAMPVVLDDALQRQDHHRDGVCRD